jgi:hypothetical protein
MTEPRAFERTARSSFAMSRNTNKGVTNRSEIATPEVKYSTMTIKDEQ